MIRVCHFCTSSVDAPYFRNISRGLVADGMSVLVGNLAPAKPPAWLPEVPGVRHFDLGAAGRAGYPGAVVRLARLLRRERVDILQTHLFDAGLVGVAAGRLARTPTVLVTRHHSDQAQLIGAKFHMALDRWTARMADGVVAVSHATRDFMVSHDPSVAGRVEVVHLGFDFAALSPTEEDRRRVREEFGFGSDFVLAFVSNFFKTKGHRYLLAALAELAREIPEVRLLLLGDGDRAPLDRLITELGLGGRVVFAGHRADAPACMRAADVVVHPSLSEAFSQVLIEAMAVGTPLVSTDVGGAREAVTDGETGLLVPPADATAIVGAVSRLYRDPELRRRLAAAARENVRRRFTVGHMVERQADCYRRMLGRPRAHGDSYVST